MPVSFSDVQLAFEFVSSGGMGENEAYLDRQSGKIYWTPQRVDRILGALRAFGIVVRRGERCLYITLSESERELRGVVARHGWTLEACQLGAMLSGSSFKLRSQIRPQPASVRCNVRPAVSHPYYRPQIRVRKVLHRQDRG